jgi:hypothetical protein
MASITSAVLGGGGNPNGDVGDEGYYEILLTPYVCGSIPTPTACGASVPIVPETSLATLNAPNISTMCSTGAVCWWYELSGFFGGYVSPTNYMQRSR